MVDENGPDANTVNVLLVDDSPEGLTLLEAVLRNAGLNLVCATSGTEALRLCSETEFALILMDVRMPEIDGIETTRLLRNSERTLHTPIICLTASDDSDDIRRAYSAGANDYVLKPYDVEVVRAKVRIFVDLFRTRAEAFALAQKISVQNEELQAQLEEIQTQHEELQAQQEELRAANTSLVEAQQTLAESEERVRTLFEHSPVGIATYRRGILIDANPAAVQMLGYDDRADLVGTPVPNVVAPSQRDEITERMRKRELGEAVPHAYETLGQRKDGSQFPLFLEAARVPLPDGMATAVFFTDISERKRAEEVQSYLVTIVQSSEEAIIGKTLDGTIQSWNPAAETLYGYSSDEVVGKHISLVVPSDKSEELQEIFGRLRRGERVEPIETVRVRQDSQRIDVSLSVSPIKGSNGQVIGASSIAHDVSERRRMQQALQEAHDTLELRVKERTAELVRANEELRTAIFERQQAETERDRLFTHSLDVFVSVGMDGAVKAVNPAIETITGLKVEEVLGRPFGEFVHPDDRAAATEHFQTVLAGTHSPSFECRIACRDGSYRWLQFAINLDSEAALVHTVGRDIAEQRQLEEALRESENKYRSLFEHLPSGFAYHRIVLDKNGQPIDYCFSEVNPAFEKMTGLQRETVLGQRVTQALPGIENSEFDWIGTYGNVALSGEPVVFEHFAEPLGRHYSVIAYSPAKNTFATVFTDVTERIRIEDRLRRANRALRMLSHCNQALIRADDEQTLLRDICRIIVDKGGYRLAWVGFAEDDAAKSVRPVAWIGYEAGYLDSLQITWSDAERGRGPIGTAIRTRQMVIARSIAADGSFGLWREEAIKRGYASIVALPLLTGSEVIGALSIYATDVNAFDSEEVDLLQELASDLAYGIVSLRTGIERDRIDEALKRSLQQLRMAFEGTIRVMALTVETRDPYTAGHQQRVAALACAIGQEMGLPEEQVNIIRLGALVHDIGKISVPAEILSKPGKISVAEFQLVKGHVEAGSGILASVEFPWPIAQIVRQHHERMNGSGYPNGLSADEILLEARILAVADVVEAMASHRPYRPAFGIEMALEEISSGSGTLYDPDVVNACLRVWEKKGAEWFVRENVSLVPAI